MNQQDASNRRLTTAIVDEGLKLISRAIDDESLIDEARALLRQWHESVQELQADASARTDLQHHLQALSDALKELQVADPALTARMRLAARGRLPSIRLRLGRLAKGLS